MHHSFRKRPARKSTLNKLRKLPAKNLVHNSRIFSDASFPVVGTIIVSIVGLSGVVLGSWFSFLSKDAELRVHLIDTSVAILRANPKENISPARDWAIRVMEKNSGVNFTEDDKATLFDYPLGVVGALRRSGNPSSNPLHPRVGAGRGEFRPIEGL